MRTALSTRSPFLLSPFLLFLPHLAFQGLFVVCGAALPRSVGVNPLLTITTVAERALDYWAQHVTAKNVLTPLDFISLFLCSLLHFFSFLPLSFTSIARDRHGSSCGGQACQIRPPRPPVH